MSVNCLGPWRSYRTGNYLVDLYQSMAMAFATNGVMVACCI